MEENYAKTLLTKYAAGQCTPEEKAIVESWYLEQEHTGIADLEANERAADMTEIRASLLSEIAPGQRPVRPLWPRIAAVASLLIGISFAGYFFLHKDTTPTPLAVVQKQDLSPGVNKAILKTGGQTIVLNTIQNAQLGNVNVHNDQLTYSPIGRETVALYDTLVNPRGSTTYHLQLVDGTKILVNAATTIRYPKTFNGKDRKVELLSGEAYFEVVHNEAMPFSVTTRHMTVEDIGTHFNISAYADEKNITATLTEGSIKVNSRVIKPGEQAISNGTSNLMVQKADLEETLAWTNGLFHFDHADLPNVMRQLARVYDVQVVYEGTMPKMTIHGEMYRSLKASQVFEGLDYLKVKFRIDGKKIIVTNKINPN